MDENNWNLSRMSGNRSKRSDSSRSGGSPRNRCSRVAPLNITRSPTYIDDMTISSLITTGMIETLGSNFAQFRVPIRQSSGFLDPNDAFGVQSDFNLEWMPKNNDVTNSMNQNKGKGSVACRFKRPEKELIDTHVIDDEYEPPKKDPRLLIPRIIMAEEQKTPDKKVTAEKQESILQWFDRSVEKELRKRRESTSADNAFSDVIPPAKDLNISKGLMDRMSEASASRIEIATQMRMQPDTELTDAVDKYAKAEAMCAFAGAVKAAEAAAEAAPPGLAAEEAAVASARLFQTEVTTTSVVREDISGIRPMEVIGYIGVTKPKYPTKPK